MRNSWLYISLFFIAIYGCQTEDQAMVEGVIPPLVQQKLDEKLRRYEQRIEEQCLEAAFREAEEIVDSLIAEELNIYGNDDNVPQRPDRPKFPGKIILNDSTKVEPVQ